MTQRTFVLIAFVIAFFVVSGGCSAANSKLTAAAEALSQTADQCLFDVRDRSLSYETSRNCSALGALSRAYIEAGGFQSEPAEIALIAERARVSAWIARAASLPGGKGISIW
jgi:hypothetical protein